VFCTITQGNGSKPGQPLEQAYIRALLPRLAKKAGIAKRVHAHGLRHSHAFELANERVPMHVIQQQLGHSNLSITSRYISHLGSSEVVEAMRNRTWRI
jgi:integrase